MSVIIQLLNLKGVFSCLPTDDEDIHLINFDGIYTLYNLPRVSQEFICLRLFPFSLIGEATLWLGEMLYRSITTFSELRIVLGPIFPAF